jgi:hypothetical protein
MKFDITDSLLFFSKNELNIFLQTFTYDEFNERIKSNNILLYLVPLFWNEYYIYKHYDCIRKEGLLRPSDAVIRIWSNNLSMSEPPNYIGGLDYQINSDHLKLQFFLSEDMIFPPKINENTNLLFNHIIIIKEEHNKNKIIIDLHHLLNAYNNFWQYFNFKPTGIRCDNNPYWFKFEKIDENLTYLLK